MPAVKVGILSNDQQDDEPIEAVVVAAIADADALIDSHLTGRYSVPLAAPVPQVIERICADLATFFLYSRKFTEEMPPGVVQRYENALALLKAMQDGRITLDVAATSFKSAVTSNKDSDSRMFTTDVLNQW